VRRLRPCRRSVGLAGLQRLTAQVFSAEGPANRKPAGPQCHRAAATLASLLRKRPIGIALSEHLEGDGEIVFRHACKMGLEGIISKRRNSPYKSGPTLNWIKSKNPESAAVLREATEDWS
jgi:hypothetical protein